MRLPSDWTAERASGWFELHHLTHGPCGYRTVRAYDLVLGEREVRDLVYRHNCGEDGEHVVMHTEPELWTVGFWSGGTWHPDSDHDSPESAEERAAELNGDPR